jgi:cytochrome P450
MANHSPILFIAVGSFLAYVLFTRITLYLNRRAFKKQNGCQECPHVFHKDPLLGIDVLRINMRNSKTHTVLESIQNRFKDLGTNTFHSRIVAMPIIQTTEPENVKTILSLKFKDYSFGAREKALAPLLGHGIFNADGERWANSRRLLRPNFARDQVGDLEAFERHFKLMLKHVPKDGSTVDLQELFFRLTIDSATEFLFNHSTNSLRTMGQDEDDNEDVIFAKAFNVAQTDVVERLRYDFLYKFTNQKKGKEAIDICKEYVDRWVDGAVRWRAEQDAEKATGGQKEEERYVFIHELAKQTNDKAQIRDELMNVLLAGRDTTASLLSNMFFEIAKRPDIWQKLREEVAMLNGRLPTYEELKNFRYLKWCLNECRSHNLFLLLLLRLLLLHGNVIIIQALPIMSTIPFSPLFDFSSMYQSLRLCVIFLPPHFPIIPCLSPSSSPSILPTISFRIPIQRQNLHNSPLTRPTALRTHPVVPGNGRMAIRDTVLPLGGGPSGTEPLFVPRGTFVSYSAYSMHRREDLYGKDAHLYKPERWETLRPGWEYLPFNGMSSFSYFPFLFDYCQVSISKRGTNSYAGGPRICLGQQYALTEAGFVTVRLVQEFARLESRDAGPWREGLTLTCCSLNGTKVGLKR